MENFELSEEKTKNWKAAEFMELDAMNHNQSLCSIVLYVNWEKQTVNVETNMSNTGTDGAVWNRMASEFSIPEDTDFTRFKAQYDEEIKPILQQLGAAFEPHWNGSNYVRRFNLDHEEQVLFEKIEELFMGFYTHEMNWFTSIKDLYEGSLGQLLDDLKKEGIDLKTANLDDPAVMEKAVETVTYWDGSDYVLLGVDAKAELKEIQKELQEEENE